MTTEETREIVQTALKRLETLTPRINSISSEINKVIAECEARLRSIDVGPAQFSYNFMDGDKITTHRSLCYEHVVNK